MNLAAIALCSALAKTPEAAAPNRAEAPVTEPAAAPATAGRPEGADSEVANVIRLGAGLQKVITVEGIASIAVAAPQIADVKPLGHDQILLVGLSPGQTGLMLFRPGKAPLQYTIAVSRVEVCGLGSLRQLEELLQAGAELQVRMIGENVLLDGVITGLDELDRVARVLEVYPTVRVLARVDPRILRRVVERINEELARSGLKNARAELHGEKLVLDGSVTDEVEYKKAQLIAEARYGPVREAIEAIRKASPGAAP